jgi:hypothetical protein
MEGARDFARYAMEEPYEYIGRMYLRDRQNPLEYYSHAEFSMRYRFSKRTVRDVLLPLVEQQPLSNRGLPIPVILKLLIALRFYATGSFQVCFIQKKSLISLFLSPDCGLYAFNYRLQLVCGDLAGVSQSSVSRIIKVCILLISAMKDRICLRNS